MAYYCLITSVAQAESTTLGVRIEYEVWEDTSPATLVGNGVVVFGIDRSLTRAQNKALLRDRLIETFQAEIRKYTDGDTALDLTDLQSALVGMRYPP